jgi:hypothetical protein
MPTTEYHHAREWGHASIEDLQTRFDESVASAEYHGTPSLDFLRPASRYSGPSVFRARSCMPYQSLEHATSLAVVR